MLKHPSNFVSNTLVPREDFCLPFIRSIARTDTDWGIASEEMGGQLVTYLHRMGRVLWRELLDPRGSSWVN